MVASDHIIFFIKEVFKLLRLQDYSDNYSNYWVFKNLFFIIMIALNSRARNAGGGSGIEGRSMEEIEGRGRGMMTTGDWCNPVSNMLHIKGVVWVF